jgi:hypothetical protein
MTFWKDLENWKFASKNTLNCLIGCSIGDFGTIIYFQIYYPHINILWIMPLAMLMGILSSLTLETLLIRFSKKAPWWQSVKLAFSMSIFSMVIMELAENATDYILTRGQVPVNSGYYWLALLCSLIVGFIVPLPYNYYKLKKYKISCH